jgi:hypothetical protein
MLHDLPFGTLALLEAAQCFVLEEGSRAPLVGASELQQLLKLAAKLEQPLGLASELEQPLGSASQQCYFSKDR